MASRRVTGQTLAGVLAEVAAGRPPPSDGRVEVLPTQGPHADDVVLATDGHLAITGDLDPDEVRAHFPPSDMARWSHPGSLAWLCARTGRAPGTADILLVGHREGGVEMDLVPAAEGHPRLVEARQHRTDVRAWSTPDEAGLLVVGRGLAGRWEVGYQVAPAARSRGLGRALAAAARVRAPTDDVIWAQVAPGNVASVRALLAAGFRPVGGEVLLRAP